jgi:beta-fructofuranosidase
MVAPAGFGLSEVGDVEVFPRGEELHLFHLTLPNHDLVHHAVSRDGLSWRALPPALRTGDPGDCDDDMIWTMSVTERAGRYYMVYTALARAEHGQVQRTALATSDDLLTWTKHPGNPVGAADPRWYEAEWDGRRRISWRDPKPILVGDTYYATVNARERAGPLLRRGCVGLLASRDLTTWEVRPPLFAPRLYYDLECPQVFALAGRYYLTAAIMEDRTQRYWVADDFHGPYRTPPGGNLLAPRGHYAGRVCAWRGQTLYFCWHRGQNDWPGIRNPAGKFIVAPLVLEPAAGGRLVQRPFPGWDAYRTAPPAPLPPAGAAHLCRPETPAPARWEVAAPTGFEVLATAGSHDDAGLTGTLTLDAAAGGLACRLDAGATGYFLRLTPGSPEVALVKWLPGHRPEEAEDFPWFNYVEVQRGQLSRPLPRGEAIPFQLLAAGPYLELSLWGEVAIAAVTGERRRGRLGLWAESGRAALGDPRFFPLRQPTYA